MARVLVTGGAGYVGCVLVPKLVRLGYAVTVLDWMMFGAGGLDEVRAACTIVEGDIRDLRCLDHALSGADAIVHLAAISNDSSGILDPALTARVNVDAAQALVRLAKQRGVRRFVFASSSSVYGVKHEPEVTEDLPPAPLTIYAQSKADMEAFLETERTAAFCPVSIRSATVCGASPRQRLDTVANLFTIDALAQGHIRVNGGEQLRPLVHIDDVADCYAHLLSAPTEAVAGQVFNAGACNETLLRIAEAVRAVIGPHVEIVRAPRSPDSRSYRISSRKLEDQLGFTCRRTLQQAVLDLRVAWDMGRIPDPSASVYRNVARMREMGFGAAP